MGIASDAAPAIIFLIAYLAYFALLTTLFAKKAISFRSRYSLVYFHVITRIGGQICGTGFAFMNWETQFNARLNMLVAYLILSAEGYFTLVMCAYRFLVVWQENRFGHSNLEPKFQPGMTGRQKRRLWFRSRIAGIHFVLMGANAMIIAGGSLLANAMSSTGQDASNSRNTGKILRVVGTAIFLVLVQIFLFCVISSWRRRSDRTLALIGFVWPFLTIRGAFGIISVVVNKYSYYNLSIYTGNGFRPSFLVGEYVLGTLMEWVACGLLITTHFSLLLGESELREGKLEGIDSEMLEDSELRTKQYGV